MTWNVGRKIGAGFGLVVAILLAVGIVSYQSTTGLVAETDLRKQTYDVLARLNQIMSLVQDVEIGQRSYVLVGDESYLEPYRAAINRIAPDIQAVRTMFGENPRQQQRLDALDRLIRDRVTFATESIDMYRAKGAEAALQSVRLGRGKGAMDEIRKVIGEMETEENELLQQRTEDAQGSAVRAQWSIILGSHIGCSPQEPRRT